MTDRPSAGLASEPPDIDILKVAVRDLVEFVLQSGDLRSTFVGPGRALAGTRGHQKIQKGRPDNYRAEVVVAFVYRTPELSLELRGRIDGVWESEDSVTLDEIKTTTLPLIELSPESQPLHWAQAKVYAYIFARQSGLEKIGVQLTYLQLDTQEIREDVAEFSLHELELFFIDLVTRYLEWASKIRDWHNLRNLSISNLTFPFRNYREGQRTLAVAVYRAIAEGRKLFAQAPTGIGKTVATVFPALKALGERKIVRIFYLTAKTVGRGVAEQTLATLGRGGLRCKVLTLTAKEKVCFLPKSDCRPEACEYARGFFDRVKPALASIFEQDCFNRVAIEDAARKAEICPFEFSLYLSLWADVIICDYNYAFDPRVYLRRFFDPPEEDYVFLIDEAHNMPDRAREMFSADLLKSEFADLRKLVKIGFPSLTRAIGRITPFFSRLFDQEPDVAEDIAESVDALNNVSNYGDGMLPRLLPELPKEFVQGLRKFQKTAEERLINLEPSAHREGILETYFRVSAFLRVAETFDQNYVCYLESGGRNKRGSDIRIKLFCLDPSELLKAGAKRAKSAIYFSATLLPLKYFFRILGGTRDDRVLELTSPFAHEQLGLIVLPGIRTEFRVRDRSFESIAEIIHTAAGSRKGNYLVYFPSFKYMTSVREAFVARHPERKIVEQQTSMTEEERDDFLRKFSSDNPETLIGFVVMGGIFGEGIDLRGDRLIGSIVVGVGLPQICLERDLIGNFFQRKSASGFEFAYRFPGMNRVMQAAGRVIRTETDRGIVILIDPRFLQDGYRKLFPKEWAHFITVSSIVLKSGKIDSDGKSWDHPLNLELERFWQNPFHHPVEPAK